MLAKLAHYRNISDVKLLEILARLQFSARKTFLFYNARY